MNPTNLTFKSIREFTAADTLYVRISEQYDHPIVALAQFVSFEKGRVTAKVVSVDTNADLYTHRIADGWVVTVALSSCALYGKVPGDDHASYHWFDALGYACYENPEQRTIRVPPSHSSYGMINISRAHSRAHPLFGSPILQGDTVTFTISEAVLNRNLNSDSFHAKNPIIELELSSQQFADMLTSPNTTGTPATIVWRDGDRVEECPFVSKLDQFASEFEQKMTDITSRVTRTVQQAKQILSGGKAPTKAERELILKGLEAFERELASNSPYIAKQFTEQMSAITSEAKTAILSFFNHEAQARGLSADPSHLPALALSDVPAPAE